MSRTCCFLERLRLFEDVTNAVFIDPPVPVAGYMDIPQEPGLGLRLNMEFITEAASDL